MAVGTSHQLANVGQADAPNVLESEVEAQQAQLAVSMAEQNQQRVWKALSAVGNPRLPLLRLEGKLEDTQPVNADELVEKIVNGSPAVRIAELSVKRAEATLARAKRKSIPDLQIRAGMQQNGELLSEPNGRSVGVQSFADAGVRIPIFNRNQGNIVTAKADLERAKREVERVKLVLRERAASVVQSYAFSQTAVDRKRSTNAPVRGVQSVLT
jgi:outer membrane protein, heavy metal efflux system